MKCLKNWCAGLLLFVVLTVPAAAQPLPELIPYKGVSGWGYSDSNKVIKIPCIYRSASLFYNGKGRVTMERDGEVVHCIVDRNGKYIIGPERHWTGEINRYSKFGMLNAHDGNGKWGGVDTAGQVIIPFEYDGPKSQDSTPSYRQYGLKSALFLLLEKEGKWGILDTNGTAVLEFENDVIEPAWTGGPDDTLCGWIVKRGNHWGYADVAGNIILPVAYDQIFNEGYGRKRKGIAFRKQDRWAWYDFQISRVVPQTFNGVPSRAGAFVTATSAGMDGPQLFSLNGDWYFGTGCGWFGEYNDTIWTMYPRNPSGTGADGYDQGWLDPAAREIRWGENPTIKREAAHTPLTLEWGFSGVIMTTGHGRVGAFEMDDRIWGIAHPVSPRVVGGLPAANDYFAVRPLYKGTDSVQFGVIDTNFNFVLPPQRRFEIIGGDLRRSFLIVVEMTDRKPSCGVVDLNFNWIVAPQKRIIGLYFQVRGKKYLIGSASPGVPPWRDWGNLRSDSDTTGPRDNWNKPMTLLNADGNIVRGFERSTAPQFFADGARLVTSPVNDLLMVSEADKVVFRKLNGRLAYRKISGKFDVVVVIGRNLLMVLNDSDRHYRLLNASGREVLPSLKGRVLDVCRTVPPSLYAKEHFWSGLRYGFAGFVEVVYSSNGNSDVEGGRFYLDRHGTIYADPDAL